jgi:branched-chain amino acid transport system substrate-binding protein
MTSSYYEAKAPIKVGYLMDIVIPENWSEGLKLDGRAPMDLVFKRGYEQGVVDRPIEVVYREVEGMPKGTVKNVIDAYQELVEEGCLIVIGPSIVDNAVPTKLEIEKRFFVPSVSMCASEEFLGEWTFSLPMGSHTEEPVFWAQLLRKGGHKEVGVIAEQSLMGELYYQNFRRAAAAEGIQITAVERLPQTFTDSSAAIRRLFDAKVPALVHCGFFFPMILSWKTFEELEWDPPRYMPTSFQNSWINEHIWRAVQGWTGMDQWDADNPVAQSFLDDYEAEYGRRPQYCIPTQIRDLATVVLHALSDAHPLTPLAVKEAMERVKMVPAACGSRGTRMSFGKWMHRGWVGSGFLVANQLDPEGINTDLTPTKLVARFDEK